MIQQGLECANCGDRIFSNSRHDYVHCDCNGIFVDGGLNYFRRGGHRIKQAIPITRELPATGPVRRYFRQETP